MGDKGKIEFAQSPGLPCPLVLFFGLHFLDLSHLPGAHEAGDEASYRENGNEHDKADEKSDWSGIVVLGPGTQHLSGDQRVG